MEHQYESNGIVRDDALHFSDEINCGPNNDGQRGELAIDCKQVPVVSIVLTGTIPRQLGELTALTHLGLDNNKLSGESLDVSSPRELPLFVLSCAFNKESETCSCANHATPMCGLGERSL